MKNILDLTFQEARAFFLKEDSYCNFDLPSYFKFEGLISSLSIKLDGKSLSDFYETIHVNENKTKSALPCDYEAVNYSFLNNKDGKYAWRPFQLIHPALYVSLVHSITEKDNWQHIKSSFNAYNENNKITCVSIPIVSETKNSDKAENVSNWWVEAEKKSLELALDFDFLLHTDIEDCYGSIYTHSIPWALHTKEIAKKERRNKSLVGNKIDKHLQDMAYGQTNGIPQGSVLMDFIAEIVLGYADQELTKKIEDEKITDYRIIRYRDDYRVFANNPNDADVIARNISEILIDLGMRLSPAKTTVSSDVVETSLKPDKLYWITQKRSYESLFEELVAIHHMAKIHPNSGSLVKALNSFFDTLRKTDKISSGVNVLISILVDIAFKNPRVYPIFAAILSELFVYISHDSVHKHIESIVKKFNKLPNTGHLEVWLQRAVLKTQLSVQCDEKLCKRVDGENVVIWNSDWLTNAMRKDIEEYSFVDIDVAESMSETIDIKEVQLFGSRSDY